MLHALVFVLSREESLPKGICNWPDLVAAQRLGLHSGTQLRLFRVPDASDLTLSALVAAGALTTSGSQPLPEDPSAQLICDALVPVIDPRGLWLGVYAVRGLQQEMESGPGLQLKVDSVECLDCYPLQEAANETCWFYPTENGRYLAWENSRTIETLPGYLPDRPPQPQALPYVHGDVHVLWSLMADDLALTCVGLTYRSQRIEWPLKSDLAEKLSNWTAFEVDASAETTYQELDSITVFPADQPET